NNLYYRRSPTDRSDQIRRGRCACLLALVRLFNLPRHEHPCALPAPPVRLVASTGARPPSHLSNTRRKYACDLATPSIITTSRISGNMDSGLDQNQRDGNAT